MQATTASPSYVHTGLGDGATRYYKVAAYDGAGNQSAGQATYAVATTTIPNRIPAFTVAPTTATIASSGGTIQFTATDADGDTLTYTLPVTRTGITINSSTGLVTVASSAAGTTGSITVRATDPSGAYAEASCAVTVQSVVQPPAGSLTHGNVFTLNGSNFGTRTDYNSGNYTAYSQRHLVKRWQDFRNGNAQTNGFYYQYSGSPYDGAGALSVLSSGAPTNSPYFMRRVYGGAGGELGGLSYDNTATPSHFYTSFKFRVTSPTSSGKFWRIWGTGSGSIALYTGGTLGLGMRGGSEWGDQGVWWGNSVQFTPNQWARVEIWIDVAARVIYGYIDGRLAMQYGGWLPAAPGFAGHTCDYPDMIDGPSRDGYVAGSYYDMCDIYADYTRARVEMTTSPTYSLANGSAVRREVQIPTAWSANSISFVVNRGEFAAGTTVYLHVIRDDGTVVSDGVARTVN